MKIAYPLIIISVITGLHAQDIQVSGKVVNRSDAPLEGVRAGINRYGLFTLTDAQGNFSFSGAETALDRTPVQETRPFIQAQDLKVRLNSTSRMFIELFDIKGQHKGHFIRTFLPGSHSVNLPAVFKDAGTGIHIVRIRMGGSTYTFRHAFISSAADESRQAVSSEPAHVKILAKTAGKDGSLDTVSFSLAGYIPKGVTIASLKIDMGTIVLDQEVTGSPVTITFDMSSPQQTFGVSRLARALREKNLRPVLVDLSGAVGNENISASIVDAQANASIQKEGFALTNTNGVLGVSAIDQTGAMYGLLELADMITIHGMSAVPEKTVNPRFPFRGIKFNTPWSSYRRHESLQLHEETVGKIEYWEGFLDMMAENRINVLSLWTIHPFPYLIRPTNYPLACPYNDAELVKWQNFWHTLFRMAKDRGIETYLVNWNIFVTQGFKENYDNNANDDHGHFGAANNSAVIEKYTRECVTQTLKEYPNLTGLGISLGEGMGGMTPLEREEWIKRVFVAGMEAADRPVKFIHRVPFSAGTGSGGSTSRETEDMTREALETINSEGPIWVEIKFNWSHGHSTPKLVQVHGGSISDAYWNPLPNNYAINWMIRNEDFFVLRWGQPDFIRRHIELNSQSYVGGYFIGSECYIPAKDYIHVPGHDHVNWTYAWERQWLFYKQWGRLLYDPETKDNVFEIDFDRRYGPGTGTKMVEAYKLGSNMPLRFGALIKSSWDFTLYSEGFLAPSLVSGHNDNNSNFLSVLELMDHQVLDPEYLSVKDYVDDVRNGTVNDAKITPLQLADELQQLGEQALAIVDGISSSNKTLECEIMDVQAWSHLNLYFAEKLRAAVALETYRVAGTNSEKTKAVSLLQSAKSQWQDAIAVTRPHHQAIPLIHTGNMDFSWELYLDEVDRDISTAQGY